VAAENEEAIVEQLYEMFDVERDVLRQDVHAFVAKLRELYIL